MSVCGRLHYYYYLHSYKKYTRRDSESVSGRVSPPDDRRWQS